MSYSPTRLFKRYFSKPEDRAVNINNYVRIFNRVMEGVKWTNHARYFILLKPSTTDDYHTFTREQHFATMRYLKQDYPELFI